MNINKMKKWIEEFKEYAEKGDILIIDNLSSHHNKEVLQMLEDYQIHVLFIPARCADVLSVLDNCFFAVYKSKWYEQLVLVDDLNDKEANAIDLFNHLIATNLGKRMYNRCGYTELFGEDDEDIDEIIKRNENDEDSD